MRRCVGLAIFCCCDFGAAGENFGDFGCFCTRENGLLRPESDERSGSGGSTPVLNSAAESRNSHYAPPLTSRAPVSFDYLKTPSLFWEKQYFLIRCAGLGPPRRGGHDHRRYARVPRERERHLATLAHAFVTTRVECVAGNRRFVFLHIFTCLK